MLNQAGYTTLLSAITLLAICYLVFWLYRRYAVDLFREEMFILRDSLFDEALAGLIDFNHPAYGMLRTTMNGYIRFGHRLSFWQFAYFSLMGNPNTTDRSRSSFDSAWNKATKELNEETKSRLDSYKVRMAMVVIKHILLNSPESLLLVPILLLLTMIFWIRDVAKSPKKVILERIGVNMDDLEEAALVYGS